MKHLVIIPVHNEEDFLRNTVETLISQTERPTQIILIDDNSSDSTPDIIHEFTDKYEWIKSFKTTQKREREVGAKVILVINEILENINLSDYEVISKLDADISLPSNYYYEIFNAFKNNKHLALSGGQCKIHINDRWEIEKVSSLDHVRGALKSYRVSAFQEIGGLLPVMDWDTLDEYMLRFKGYQVKTIENLHVKHHRPTDSASKWFKITKLAAKSFNELGYDSFFAFALSMEKAFKKKPLLVNGFIQFFYFLKYKYVQPQKPIISNELSRYIAAYRFNKLRQKIKGLVG